MFISGAKLADLFLRVYLKGLITTYRVPMHTRRKPCWQNAKSDTKVYTVCFVVSFTQLNLPLLKRNEMWLLFGNGRKKTFCCNSVFNHKRQFFLVTFQVKWLTLFPLHQHALSCFLLQMSSWLMEPKADWGACKHSCWSRSHLGHRIPPLTHCISIKFKRGADLCLPFAICVSPNDQ